jgi:UDP-hydrolysing UDP-N-acetyl-D-glucosamine 2-epimerase
MPRRRICFVTGTRADFGLMNTALRAIGAHPGLSLQIVVTGMHLDRRRGRTVSGLRAEGWSIDAVVPWARSDAPAARTAATGRAIARLAELFGKLRPDVVLIVGDRVEALAAAVAGHLSDLAVAHVHGGDRALGQADDALRHAITKLSHVHFAATRSSGQRLLNLGEDRWRVHVVGAPGIDQITRAAAGRASTRRLIGSNEPFALLIQHPTEPDPAIEFRRAESLIRALLRSGIPRVAIIDPNNDPGAEGIVQCWDQIDPSERRVVRFANLPRAEFLGLLRDTVVLVGNSSAGMIEAASFGTPVIDIGPRQSGREHGPNVLHAPCAAASVRKRIAGIWRMGDPIRFPSRNPYGGAGAGRRIAQTLASLKVNARLLRKLIAY